MTLHFSREEYDHRRDRLIGTMEESGLDAMLLFSQESMYWLTGFDSFGFCFFQCLIVRANGDMSLLTRMPDLRQAKHTSTIEDIHVWMDWGDVGPVGQLRDLMDSLDMLGENIGVEYDTAGLTAFYGRQLDDRLKSFGNLTDASKIIPNLRAKKSYAEIEFIREAAVMADDALEAGLAVIKPGANDADVLTAMQGSVFAAGGGYPGNGFIVGSGKDALLCRTKSGRRILEEQDQITLEFAGASKNYHSALMRTVVLGEPTERHLELFDAAKTAMTACEEVMTPEHTFGDVFEAHASVLDERGLHPHRLNACGYSLGARFAPSWMDTPMFYRQNMEQIVPNMSLFLHIIIMDSETETAMTLGRTYLTTSEAPEPLSRLPIELISING
ncbi:MAG: Xaa-Pro peptidase family protein [Hyphomicrobiales bacterium]